ncbi:helix-turn-helix transcriptional regulator [Niveibacterium sp. SC-1]|uniref:helix-turn-helix transcriptional regulator n=1 Tax=Niveibacterium sp. SC-1 TaxID=3135646 RepID=UPI00311E6D4E
MMDLARQYGASFKRPPVLELSGKPIRKLEPGLPNACELRFEQDRNRLLLNLRGADAPYAQHNRLVFEACIKRAKTEVKALVRLESFSAKTEDLLLQLIRKQADWTNASSILEQACEVFGISRSALHRRLQKENTNFQSVFSRVRLEEAKRLLVQDGRSLSDIGDLLGFSSLSVFSRFFYEQVGISPSRYRAAQQGDIRLSA